jgi:hypothetical protein
VRGEPELERETENRKQDSGVRMREFGLDEDSFVILESVSSVGIIRMNRCWMLQILDSDSCFLFSEFLFH